MGSVTGRARAQDEKIGAAEPGCPVEQAERHVMVVGVERHHEARDTERRGVIAPALDGGLRMMDGGRAIFVAQARPAVARVVAKGERRMGAGIARLQLDRLLQQRDRDGGLEQYQSRAKAAALIRWGSGRRSPTPSCGSWARPLPPWARSTRDR